MNSHDYKGLMIGDLIRHKSSGKAMRIVEIVDGIPVAIRTQTVCNPIEWDKVDETGRVISED